MKPNRFKCCVYLPILLGALITFAVSGCGGAGDEYVGHWRDANVDVTIIHQNGNYILQCSNPVGLLNGTYAAKYENGSLKLAEEFLGNVTYLKDEDAILIAGAKLHKVK